MALVEGTNCGFVTVAPTADPGATDLRADNTSRTGKFTAPAGASKITEIGWYCDNATDEGNFELGVYSDDGNGATSLPVTLAAGVSRTNAKGTDAGWKKATVDIAITAGTIYWLAVQLDATSSATNTNYTTSGGRRSYMSVQNFLASTWSSEGASDHIMAIYAVYTGSAPAAIMTLKKYW
jgi:hypothetical protein